MSQFHCLNDPKLIILGLANYIACIGAIPLDWIKTYSEYDACNDCIRVRIDCLGVTYSSYFNNVPNQAKEASKLLPEIDKFIMLLWGESNHEAMK